MNIYINPLDQGTAEVCPCRREDRPVSTFQTCTRCGSPATHLHVDQLRSFNDALCDLCCDGNCQHRNDAYWKCRDSVFERSDVGASLYRDCR